MWLPATPSSLQSQAHHGFRRASDSLIAVRPPQKFVKHSPMLAAHRERAAQLVPDTTISAANIAKKIGKGERESELCMVCSFHHLLVPKHIDLLHRND